MQADAALSRHSRRCRSRMSTTLSRSGERSGGFKWAPAFARTTLTSCPAAGVMADQAGAASSRVGWS